MSSKEDLDLSLLDLVPPYQPHSPLMAKEKYTYLQE